MRSKTRAICRWTLTALFVTSAVPTVFANETSERMAKAYKDARARVQFAYVEFDVKSVNLLPMDTLEKHGVAAYLVDQTVTFAVGPKKHYFRELNHSGPPGLIMDRVQVWKPGGVVQERRPNPGFSNPNAPTDVPMYYIERPDVNRGARFNCIYFNSICFDYPDITRVETNVDHAQDPTPWLFESVPMILLCPDMTVSPGMDKIDGAPCIVVRVDKRQTLWFDPAINYAIRKRELFEAGDLKYQILMKDFVNTSAGQSVPRSIAFTTYATGSLPPDIKGKPALRHELKMTRLEINNPKRDELFTMNIEPGALVVDTTIAPVGSKGEIGPKSDGTIPAVTYRQPATEADLNEVVDEARRDVGYWHEARNKNWAKLAIITLVTIGVAIGVYFWQKRSVH